MTRFVFCNFLLIDSYFYKKLIMPPKYRLVIQLNYTALRFTPVTGILARKDPSIHNPFLTELFSPMFIHPSKRTTFLQILSSEMFRIAKRCSNKRLIIKYSTMY